MIINKTNKQTNSLLVKHLLSTEKNGACVSVCLCACAYVHTCVCVCVCVHACVHTGMCVCEHACVRAYVRVCGACILTESDCDPDSCVSFVAVFLAMFVRVLMSLSVAANF